MRGNFICNRQTVHLEEITCIEAFPGEHYCLYTDGFDFFYTASADTREVINTHAATEEEAFAELKNYIAALTGIDTNTWYAVMQDMDDDDWGYGSHILEEAKKKCRNIGPEAYIAVIDVCENPTCIKIIHQEDFDEF